MFKFQNLAPVLLFSILFTASAQAATIDFTAVVTESPIEGTDTPGAGVLTYDDALVNATGTSFLTSDQMSFSLTLFGQTFSDDDTAEPLRHFASFMDGQLDVFAFLIVEELFPESPQIDKPGVYAIGSAPVPHGVDANGNPVISLWINGDIPQQFALDVAAVPLPGGFVLAGGALALLGGLRRLKSNA